MTIMIYLNENNSKSTKNHFLFIVIVPPFQLYFYPHLYPHPTKKNNPSYIVLTGVIIDLLVPGTGLEPAHPCEY
jgi:hypothetical protein